MTLKRLGAVLGLLALLFTMGVAAQGQDDDLRARIEEMRQQQAQVDDLKARLAELEKRLDASEKQQAQTAQAQAAAPPAVTSTFPGDKLTIDGRIFIGQFASGKDGADPIGSTNIPDAKLRFTMRPSECVVIVSRFSIGGGQPAQSPPSIDYLYLDYAKLLGPTNTIRIGQRKIDFGQETWVDNPIENITINPSVSLVNGYGTGIALLGKFNGAPLSPLYEVGFVNGPKGLMVRPTGGLTYNIKVGTPLPNNLFASGSYFNTGKLGGSNNSALGVAGLVAAPTGATQWQRGIWEIDLRYNCGSSGVRTVVPWGDPPKVMLGATYGAFNDSAVGAAARNGSYWFAEGLLMLTPKLYTGARYSVTSLNSGAVAALGGSSVPVNSYDRTSLALGYRLSNLTVLKTEYAFNHTTGGASQPSLNQWGLGVASRF